MSSLLRFSFATFRATLIVALTINLSCATKKSEPPASPGAHPNKAVAKVVPPAMTDTQPRDYPGLHNVVAYHHDFFSGSAPEGDAGFATLAAMGVRTIISVDGAEPEVARAKSRGIRYIHLPIGYNGFDDQRRLQLVRASRDAFKDGPVYIHCHHGKHRSAGAAGTVIACLGMDTSERMVQRMKVSGTSPGYKGLYAATAGAIVINPRVIDAVPADFPEVSRPTGFVKGMVEIDEINERLKLIEAAGWVVPTDHPDLVPAAEAGRMADLLRVLSVSRRAKSKPGDFAQMLRANGQQVSQLEEMLASGRKNSAGLSDQFKLIAASCKDCHIKYRD